MKKHLERQFQLPYDYSTSDNIKITDLSHFLLAFCVGMNKKYDLYAPYDGKKRQASSRFIFAILIDRGFFHAVLPTVSKIDRAGFWSEIPPVRLLDFLI